jgi:hypothetical protein
MTIRQQIGKILGYTITDEGFSKAFETLRKEGRITTRHILDILLVLIEREENRENE